MTTMSAKELENWAEDIARTMESCSASRWRRTVNRHGFDYCNIKPWYNPSWMFEPRTDRVDCVFIGINPGGKPERPGPTVDPARCVDTCDHDKLAYYDDALSDTPYNDWLDARCWQGKGETEHQKRAKRVFSDLFDIESPENMMRWTPFFNVCPLRTKGSGQIPDCVWKRSLTWCKSVLDQLRPRLIICDGNAKLGKSPWVMLKSEYKLEKIRCKKIGDTDFSLKSGESPFEGTKVLALPHLTSVPLSHEDREHLFGLLSKRSDWITQLGRE